MLLLEELFCCQVASLLNADDSVADKHCSTQCGCVFGHLRETELGVFVHQVKRELVGSRFERQHQELARLGQVTSDNHGLGVENVDKEKWNPKTAWTDEFFKKL